MDIINYDFITDIKNILIIDNLSYFENIYNYNIKKIIENIKKKFKKSQIYIISNTINLDCEYIHINQNYISEFNNYFNNKKIFFDLIIDNNIFDDNNQLSTFTLFYSRLNINKFYFILFKNNKNNIKNNTNLNKFVYNLKLFSNYVFNTDKYLIIKKN